MNSNSNNFEPSEIAKSLAVAASTAFSAAIDESGKTIEKICEDTRDEQRCIEHQPSFILQWCQPAKTAKGQSPLLRAAVILAATNDITPLQWLCGQVGGVFVPDASSYGILQLSQNAPKEIKDFPEMAEWLTHSQKMANLKRAFYEFVMDGDCNDANRVANLVLPWLSVKGWIEGYLEWTGSPGQELRRLSRATDDSKAVSSWQVILRAFSRNPVGQPNKQPAGQPHTKRIAGLLGLSDSSVQKWQQLPDPNKSGSANPFDHLAVLSHATSSLIMINWLCSLMKGKLRSSKTDRTDSNPPWPRVYWEMTKLEYFVSSALLDGDVKPDEATKIREEWDDVRAWMASLLRSRCNLNA